MLYYLYIRFPDKTQTSSERDNLTTNWKKSIVYCIQWDVEFIKHIVCELLDILRGTFYKLDICFLPVCLPWRSK